jgi:hypothetical protein
MKVQRVTMSRLTSVMKLPTLFSVVFVASIVVCTVCFVYAVYDIADTGVWPKSWYQHRDTVRARQRFGVFPRPNWPSL